MKNNKNSIEIMKNLANKFESVENLSLMKKSLSNKKILLGFDGFIDTFIEIVEKRINPQEYLKMSSMKTWANRIYESSGSSANLERVIKKQTAGGLTSNVGKAMIELFETITAYKTNFNHPSPEIHCIGTYGSRGDPENLNNVFIENMKIDSVLNVKPIFLHSFDEPGATDAYEFGDGKVMMSFFEPMNRMKWSNIIDRFGYDWLFEIFSSSDIISLGYWSVIPDFSDIMKCVVNEILLKMENTIFKKDLFLDLGDIRKKPREQIITFVKYLKDLNQSIKISISLNHTEAFTLLNAHQIQYNKENISSLPKLIYKILPIERIIIHSPKIASVFVNNEILSIQQAYTSSPKFSTSAGDHFNAGYMFGIACELSEIECLSLGNLNSAAYVRLGSSPGIEKLLKIAKNYDSYIENDIDSI